MNAHYMNARDAYAIAFATHSDIQRNFDMRGATINAYNIDEINAYYSLMMQFTLHNDFIDSCAFDSMVELDNILELIADNVHDVMNWTMDDFVMHYKHDMNAMHHYKSLSLHGMDALHNRAICAYCSPDEIDACCMDMKFDGMRFTTIDGM